MEYKSLKKIFYSENDNYNAEYNRRLNSFGTIKTELFPYLMKKEEFASSSYPLFSVPLLEIQYLSQQIIEKSQIIVNLADRLPDVAHSQFYNEQLFNANS